MIKLATSYDGKIRILGNGAYNRITSKAFCPNSDISQHTEDQNCYTDNLFIHDIKVSGVGLEFLKWKTFAPLVKLRILDISVNHLKKLNFDIFDNNLKLENLNVSRNHIKRLLKADNDNNLPNLKVLDISNNWIRKLDLTIFVNYHRLEYIYASNNYIEYMNGNLMALSSLVYISLKDNHISDLNVKRFVDFIYSSNTKIDMRDNARRMTMTCDKNGISFTNYRIPSNALFSDYTDIAWIFEKNDDYAIFPANCLFNYLKYEDQCTRYESEFKFYRSKCKGE